MKNGHYDEQKHIKTFTGLFQEKRRHITLTMPIGITTDVLITCLGAVLGVVLGTRLPDSLKKALNNTLGIAAIAMGHRSDLESKEPFGCCSDIGDR